jgi:hypothetical protein
VLGFCGAAPIVRVRLAHVLTHKFMKSMNVESKPGPGDEARRFDARLSTNFPDDFTHTINGQGDLITQSWRRYREIVSKAGDISDGTAHDSDDNYLPMSEDQRKY